MENQNLFVEVSKGWAILIFLILLVLIGFFIYFFYFKEEYFISKSFFPITGYQKVEWWVGPADKKYPEREIRLNEEYEVPITIKNNFATPINASVLSFIYFEYYENKTKHNKTILSEGNVTLLKLKPRETYFKVERFKIEDEKLCNATKTQLVINLLYTTDLKFTKLLEFGKKVPSKIFTSSFGEVYLYLTPNPFYASDKSLTLYLEIRPFERPPSLVGVDEIEIQPLNYTIIIKKGFKEEKKSISYELNNCSFKVHGLRGKVLGPCIIKGPFLIEKGKKEILDCRKFQDVCKKLEEKFTEVKEGIEFQFILKKSLISDVKTFSLYPKCS